MHCDVHRLLYELDVLDDDLLLLDLPLHEHGPEVHPALDGDEELEGEVGLAVAVGEDALVVSLLFLTALLDPEDDLTGVAVGVDLVAGLHVQVLEALEELDLGRRVALHKETDEVGVALREETIHC